MILNVKERLLLLSMLPSEGSLTQMVDVYDLVRELKLSDDEKKQIAFKEDSQSITWDGDIEKEFTLSSDQISIVNSCIDKYDKEKRINIEYIPLILKFKNNG